MGNDRSLPSGIKDVKFLEKIGEGSFGRVYKAEWKGETVAAKQLMEYLFHRDDDITGRFRVECQTLLGLNHANIVKMYDLVEPGGEMPPILITELLHCDLQTYIKNSTANSNLIPLREVVNITLDVAEGLKFLHNRSLPIAHRDLASKNVLLTKDKRAKIADLGLARVFVCPAFASPIPGTPLYAAPETFPSKASPSGVFLNPAYDVRVDVFSFGVLLLEVITGRPPRPRPLMSPVTEAGDLIPEHHRRRNDIEEMGNDHRLADIVLRCLENDSVARPTIQKIVEKLNAEKENIDRKIRIASSGHVAKLKFLSLGGIHVGKTCIFERFVNPRFDTELVAPTVGPMCHTTTVTHNGITFSLYFQDTAGQERFNSIPPIYFRDVDAIMLVFDISDRASFAKIPGVIQLISCHSRFEVSMILVGNKADRSRQVQQEEAEEFAKSYAMRYIETSAKTGQNIERLFEQVVQMVYDRLDLGDIEIYFPTEGIPGESQSLCGKFMALFGISSSP